MRTIRTITHSEHDLGRGGTGSWLPLGGLLVLTCGMVVLYWVMVGESLAGRVPTTIQVGVEHYRLWASSFNLLADAVPWCLFILTTLTVCLFVRNRLDRTGWALLSIWFVLAGLGAIMLARLAPFLAMRYANASLVHLCRKHLMWATVGMAMIGALMMFMKDRHYTTIADRKTLCVVTAIALIVLTSIAGSEVNGRRLWLALGPLRFQTVELVKVLLVFFASAYFAERTSLTSKRAYGFSLPPMAQVGPFMLMVALSLTPIVLQGDLGPTFLLATLFMVIFYAGTSSALSIVIGCAGMFGLGLAGYIAGSPSILRTRIDMWLRPFERSEHIAKSLWAVSSGGMFGSGIARGLPQTVPVVHTDSIFAAICEEWGFVGATAIVALYLMQALCGYTVAARSSDRFKRFLALSITTMLTLQALVIMAGMVGLVPLTGVTLPFVSYGGSSMVCNAILCGILLNISAARKESHHG